MAYKLVIFDGDETLWQGPDGVGISDNGASDMEGDNGLRFAADDSTLIVRSDDKRVELYPEAREVLATLKQRGVLVALCTWNHPSPVNSALKAWRLEPYFNCVVAEWNPDKEHMLRAIVQQLGVQPNEAVFVDDDPRRGHREQAERVGVAFRQKGTEITDLRQVLALV